MFPINSNLFMKEVIKFALSLESNFGMLKQDKVEADKGNRTQSPRLEIGCSSH